MANKTQEMGPADLGLTITPQKVFGVENKTFSLILFRFFRPLLPAFFAFVALNVLQLLPGYKSCLFGIQILASL